MTTESTNRGLSARDIYARRKTERAQAAGGDDGVDGEPVGDRGSASAENVYARRRADRERRDAG